MRCNECVKLAVLSLDDLKRSNLERDDETDPGGRIYRDQDGEIYHSVTRILQATSKGKANLEAWKQRLGPELAAVERDTAAERGTRTHNAAEYVLKTAKKMSDATGKRRKVLYARSDDLVRPPAPLVRWAIKQVLPSAPKVGFSANGYKRCLLTWIEQHVTAIHAIEFSVRHPAGFAGTCDALLDVDGQGPCLVDWKTSANKRNEDMLTDYMHQLGAYSLGMKHLTGIEAKGAYVVVARRAGAANIRQLSHLELRGAEQCFLDRCHGYYESLLTEASKLPESQDTALN
jgi:ATP-dependent exoDNAse (exonuclease V) beta subunit